MTELLYLEDGYLREFDASVVAEGSHEIALDRTAFFPGGGGQPPDAGQLRWPGGEARVVGLKKDGDLAWHILEGPAPSFRRAAGSSCAGCPVKSSNAPISCGWPGTWCRRSWSGSA